MATGQQKRDFALAAVLFGLPLLLFWKLVFTDEVLYWGTPLLQFFPWRTFAVESYLAGRVPLWNPYLGNGAPFAANWQSAVFYPLNVIYFLFPVEKAMGYSVVLHVGLSGVFMFVFGRILGLSRFGSFIAGLAYALSGFLVSRTEFLSMTSTVTWLPIIMAVTERILQRKAAGDKETSTWLLVALGALAVGLLLFAGHGQLSFYSLLLVVTYALFRGWFRPALPVLGMVALGVGIAAVQLTLTAELAFSSVRAGGADYDFAMAYSLYPWQVLGLLAPDFFGNPAEGNYWGPGNYWEASGYIGVLPLLAAIVGVAVSSRVSRSVTLFLVGTAVVSLIFAFGRYLPVYPFVFAHIPGFGFFQAPARFLFCYTFAMSVLAGIGGDAMLTQAGTKGLDRVARIASVAGISIAIAMGVFFLMLGPTEDVRPTFLGALAKLGVLLGISGLIILLGKQLPKRWWQAAMGLFVAVDLLVFGFPLNPTTAPWVYRNEGMPTTDFLRHGEGIYRVYTPDAAFLKKFFDTHSFRSFGSSQPEEVRRTRDSAIPDVAMTAGLQEAYNYDPLQVGFVKDFLKTVDASGLDSRLLALMNVRYVLTDTVPVASDLRLALGGSNPVYEVPSFMDRAYVVDGEVVKVSSAQEALQEVAKPQFEPRRAVVVNEPQPSSILGLAIGWPGDAYSAGPSTATEYAVKKGTTIVEYAPDRVKIVTMIDRAGYLVLSDTYYPGWKAWVNGQPATVYQANAVFRAVQVPAGLSLVEFRYEPATFKLGVAISGFAVAIVAALAMWGAMKRRVR